LVKCNIKEFVWTNMQGKAHANSSTEKSVEAPTIKKVRRAECSPGGGVKVYLEENSVTVV
jgi:hypothetical protein